MNGEEGVVLVGEKPTLCCNLAQQHLFRISTSAHEKKLINAIQVLWSNAKCLGMMLLVNDKD